MNWYFKPVTQAIQNWLIWHQIVHAKANKQAAPQAAPLIDANVVYFGESCPNPLIPTLAGLDPEKNILLQHPARKKPTSCTPAQIIGEWDALKKVYDRGEIPDLDSNLRVDLFNTLRSELFPDHYPVKLTLRSDHRGSLFEAVRAHQKGQAFISTTKPGIVRGNHFHLHKVERFCVISGKATIRLRKLFSTDIAVFDVSGEQPSFIDIPTLHTHDITNTGTSDLITLFWSNEFYDPDHPDTWTENVG